MFITEQEKINKRIILSNKIIASFNAYLYSKKNNSVIKLASNDIVIKNYKDYIKDYRKVLSAFNGYDSKDFDLKIKDIQNRGKKNPDIIRSLIEKDKKIHDELFQRVFKTVDTVLSKAPMSDNKSVLEDIVTDSAIQLFAPELKKQERIEKLKDSGKDINETKISRSTSIYDLIAQNDGTRSLMAQIYSFLYSIMMNSSAKRTKNNENAVSLDGEILNAKGDSKTTIQDQIADENPTYQPEEHLIEKEEFENEEKENILLNEAKIGITILNKYSNLISGLERVIKTNTSIESRSKNTEAEATLYILKNKKLKVESEIEKYNKDKEEAPALFLKRKEYLESMSGPNASSVLSKLVSFSGSMEKAKEKIKQLKERVSAGEPVFNDNNFIKKLNDDYEIFINELQTKKTEKNKSFLEKEEKNSIQFQQDKKDNLTPFINSQRRKMQSPVTHDEVAIVAIERAKRLLPKIYAALKLPVLSIKSTNFSTRDMNSQVYEQMDLLSKVIYAKHVATARVFYENMHYNMYNKPLDVGDTGVRFSIVLKEELQKLETELSKGLPGNLATKIQEQIDAKRNSKAQDVFKTVAINQRAAVYNDIVNQSGKPWGELTDNDIESMTNDVFEEINSMGEAPTMVHKNTPSDLNIYKIYPRNVEYLKFVYKNEMIKIRNHFKNNTNASGKAWIHEEASDSNLFTSPGVARGRRRE